MSFGTRGPWASSGKITQVDPLPPLGRLSLPSHFSVLIWKLWLPTWNEAERMVEGNVDGITCVLLSAVSLAVSREIVRDLLVRLTSTILAARNLLPVVR